MGNCHPGNSGLIFKVTKLMLVLSQWELGDTLSPLKMMTSVGIFFEESTLS